MDWSCCCRTPAEAAAEAAASAAVAKAARPSGRPRKLATVPASQPASSSRPKHPSHQGSSSAHGLRPRARSQSAAKTLRSPPTNSPSSSQEFAADLAPGLLLNPTSPNSAPGLLKAANAKAVRQETDAAFPSASLTAAAAVMTDNVAAC